MSDLDDHIDAASALIALDLDEAYRPGVMAYLKVAKQMAEVVEAAPIDMDEFALAPVYRPPERSA